MTHLQQLPMTVACHLSCSLWCCLGQRRCMSRCFWLKSSQRTTCCNLLSLVMQY